MGRPKRLSSMRRLLTTSRAFRRTPRVESICCCRQEHDHREQHRRRFSNCFNSTTFFAIDQGNNFEFPGNSCGFSRPSDVLADPGLGVLAFHGGLRDDGATGGSLGARCRRRWCVCLVTDRQQRSARCEQIGGGGRALRHRGFRAGYDYGTVRLRGRLPH